MSEQKPERMKRTGTKPIPLQEPTQPGEKTLKVAKDIQQAEIPMRRRAMLMVQPGDFMFLFKKGMRFQKNFKVVKGLPEDAKLISVVGESHRNGIMMVVESKEFDEIPMTQLPPIVPIEIDLDGAKNATKKKATPRKKKK